MSLLLAWLFFPAVALSVCAGLGLLVERASGGRLPGVLLLPVGVAGLVCATQLTTYSDATAESTLPLVVLLAAAGVVLGRQRLRGSRPDLWAAGAAAGGFLVSGAPVLLSGEATFAGYTVLGDTSIHFIGADALLELGRDLSSLPPSSYEYSLSAYYGANGYPSGGPTAVGAVTSLAGQDVAWTFQPFLSLLVALMALALYSLAARLIEPRALRAVAAFVAAQPALVVAYALQGSVKEVGTAFGVVLVGALLAVWVRQAADGARRVVPLAVAASAVVGIVGLAGGVWLGPFALAALVAALAGPRRVAPRRLAGAAALALALCAGLSYQALADLTRYVDVAGAVVTSQAEFGNLLGPLDERQRFGIWLTGDYRVPPTGLQGETQAFLWIVWAAMALGVFWLVRRRAWAVACLVVVSVVAHVYVMRNGSPWADGKALMIVSPVLLLLATAGAGAAAAWRRAAGWLVVAAVGAGVVWSNALAYHDVSNAPRERMAELDRIGERIAGQGPTLYPEFEEFAKHFLRDSAPEGATEGWQRRHALSVGRNGQHVLQGFSTDLDRFTDRYLAEYRTIVLRRGFASSRPPSTFRRTLRGRFYEVFQRPEAARGRLVEHLPAGDFRDPSARPRCRDVRRLARRARRAGAHLAYLERPRNIVAVPAEAALPNGWYVDTADGSVVVTRGAGLLEVGLDVPAGGEYDMWLEGSFGRTVHVLVDGRVHRSVARRLNGRGSAEHLGRIRLDAGRHRVSIRRDGGDLRPGDGGNRLLGPLALTPVDPTGLPIRTLAPERWRTLCGRSLDWVDAVRD